jgi:4-aminobutyrate aminotransferase-like enzyme/Ser/Thr protein kinase RdoA (MazF antagonist)
MDASDVDAGEVLSAEPPSFTDADAARIALEVFGVEGVASALRSERDQNFRLDSADGETFVVKISNTGEDLAVLEMENEGMAHAVQVDPSLPVPAIRATVAGDPIGYAEGRPGQHLVRLVRFMPGALLEAEELDDRQLREFGATLARLGRALRGFFHPAAGRVLQWDLQHAPKLRPLLESIPPGAERDLVTGMLARWEADVAPRFGRLRAQVVHGDLSLDNTLFAPDGTVSGVIDFGDMSHTALLCDLGVGLVSTMSGRADALRAGAIVVAGYETVTPLEALERELLPAFVEMRLATSLAIAAWRVAMYPENAEYITTDSPRFVALLSELQALGGEAAAAALASSALSGVGGDELVRRRRRAFGPAMQKLTYDRPLHMVRAEGVWMIDAVGRRYLDAYNNVPVVGHSHPRVVDAIARQGRLLNTNMRYLHGAAVELAERLLATTPPELDTCLFVNSGSEANELAWRILTATTGHGGGIVTEHAYHGVTTATAALSPEEWSDQDPPANVARIPAPDGYRGRYRYEQPDYAERYAACLDDAVGSLRERGFEPGAVVIDSGYTSDGILTPPPVYLRELVRRAHDVGAGFVADEVQAGHGRTGEHLWSFTASGVVPDMVTLGKPMGNGYPVAAVLLRSDIAAAMSERTTYFSTFGGNPVACAAALAVLDVIEEDQLIENARVVGEYLREALRELASQHEVIGDVRGRGLLIGVELVRDRETREPNGPLASDVVNALRERGVLVGRCGKADSALKIRPPLVFDHANADLLVARLDEALAAASH